MVMVSKKEYYAYRDKWKKRWEGLALSGRRLKRIDALKCEACSVTLDVSAVKSSPFCPECPIDWTYIRDDYAREIPYYVCMLACSRLKRHTKAGSAKERRKIAQEIVRHTRWIPYSKYIRGL